MQSYNGALFPADVIKSRQQTADELDGPKAVQKDVKPQRRGFLQVARELYTTEGVKGFYRGCLITVARSAPTSAVIFLTYEMLSRNFSI